MFTDSFSVVCESAGHQEWKEEGLEPEFLIPELSVGQLFGKVSSSLEYCTPLHLHVAALCNLGCNERVQRQAGCLDGHTPLPGTGAEE